MPRPKRDRIRQAIENSQRVKYKKFKTKEKIEPAKGGWTCWCGKPMNHNWPGKADGKPHPR